MKFQKKNVEKPKSPQTNKATSHCNIYWYI